MRLHSYRGIHYLPLTTAQYGKTAVPLIREGMVVTLHLRKSCLHYRTISGASVLV